MFILAQTKKYLRKVLINNTIHRVPQKLVVLVLVSFPQLVECHIFSVQLIKDTVITQQQEGWYSLWIELGTVCNFMHLAFFKLKAKVQTELGEWIISYDSKSPNPNLNMFYVLSFIFYFLDKKDWYWHLDSGLMHLFIYTEEGQNRSLNVLINSVSVSISIPAAILINRIASID